MSARDDAVILALQRTLELEPQNGPLWLHYADVLSQSGRREESLAALRTALELVDEREQVLRRMVPLLRQGGQLAEALFRAETLLEVKDEPEVRLEYARVLKARGDHPGALAQYLQALNEGEQWKDAELESLRGILTPEAAPRVPFNLDAWPARDPLDEPAPPRDLIEEPDDDPEPAMAGINPGTDAIDGWAERLDWGDLYTSFADVAGLQEVKNQINLRIIAPFKNPQIYQAFRRSAGGGILLYGPPGCGKTFIARATAGECGARFMSVGIHEIVDKYWGESEKMMHALFEEARRRAPTVLFFDEFDALGSSRGRVESQFWKTLVDQLLQEMDGMSGRNDEILIFAATNVPWNVDPAFRRPGRFDRVIFVPPPDEAARAEILKCHSERLPGGDSVDVAMLARETPLMTGADLKALCERAAEKALSRSLDENRIHPVTMEDFDRERKQMQTSASEWLTTARNYARYSNEGGQYDELVEFLKRNRRW